MAWIRVFCVVGGKVRRRDFDDRREAWEYAEEQAKRGILCFISG
jgi:hypothetical protein